MLKFLAKKANIFSKKNDKIQRLVVLDCVFCIDGFKDGHFIGWLDESVDSIKLAVNGQHLVYVELKQPRIDVYDTLKITANHLSAPMDGSFIQKEWLHLTNWQVNITFNRDDQSESILMTFPAQQVINNMACYGDHDLTEAKNLIAESLLWDPVFYASQINNGRLTHEDLIIDYLLFGCMEQSDPCAEFSGTYYSSQNIDLLANGINPLVHYLTFGEEKGCQPNAYFQPAHYLACNPDLKNWELSLLAHYFLHGKAEGRALTATEQAASEVDSTRLYTQWILKNEALSYQFVRQTLAGFNFSPLISIIMPVYNPPEKFLIQCIESVINQSYENWELCIADDHSTKEYVSLVLNKFSEADKRIKVAYRSENGHISLASNSAIKLAAGEWLALLDHDDLLHEHALYHVVDCLNQNPKAELIYSDEDKVDESNRRYEPHFKPDWNLDLLHSQNYVSHLGVYKTAIVNRIGGFRKGYEGSQDYDLLLRYSKKIDHASIYHIPKILYHWRAIEGSTATAAGEKNYTIKAGVKALRGYFESISENVSVEPGLVPNTYKVNWPIEAEPLVSLIIPTYNGYEITKQAIDSILEKTQYKNYEIILVDNNSDCKKALTYFDKVQKNEKVNVVRYPNPFNFSAINNYAVKYTRGSIIGLINNDIEVINGDWLSEMVSHVIREDIGCVGAKLYYPNDIIQHAGVVLGMGGVAGHGHKHLQMQHPGYFGRLMVAQNYSAVTAACLLVRKSIFQEVGGLNENDLTVAFNDVDFCLKVQEAGYRNLWTPYAELYHHESLSRGTEDTAEKQERFAREVDYMKSKWGQYLQSDPYYSVNLSYVTPGFSIEI